MRVPMTWATMGLCLLDELILSLPRVHVDLACIRKKLAKLVNRRRQNTHAQLSASWRVGVTCAPTGGGTRHRGGSTLPMPTEALGESVSRRYRNLPPFQGAVLRPKDDAASTRRSR